MNEPLKNKTQGGKRQVPKFHYDKDIKSAVELLRTHLKEKYGNNYLINHKENEVIDKLIDNDFPDLCPSGDLLQKGNSGLNQKNERV